MRSISGIFIAQLMLCFGIITGEDDSSWRCPQGLPDTTAVYTYRDHCYQFVDNEVYWTAARAYCMRHGGSLVKVDDRGTNDFLVQTLNTLPWRNRGIWIGLHDRNGELDWEWVTRSPLVEENVHWTNWGRGHPKGVLHGLRDCVRMVRGRRKDWRWHETFCSVLNWKYKFICQYDAEPLPTTPPRVFAAPRRDMRRGGASHLQDSYRQVDSLAAGDDGGGLHGEGAQVGMPVSGRELAVQGGQVQGERPSGLGLITTVIISCMVGSMVGIVLLVLLLIRRRRRQRVHDDPTLRIDNPTYGPEDQPKEKVLNDYTINVYTNPLELRKDLSDDQCPPPGDLNTKWDYINTVNAALASGYLPMDGGKYAKDPDEEGQRDSHIYEDIPEFLTEDLKPDAKGTPAEAQIYEELQDPTDNH